MAEEVELNPGAGGAKVAVDTIAAQQYQLIKLVHGADGVVDGYVSSASPLPVGGTLAVSAVVPGTGATNLGKAEDSPHASGDTGVPLWAVRRDAATSGVSADGDYATLNVDSLGRLWTRIGDGTCNVQGMSDHDDLPVAWPVRIGSIASGVLPTLVSTGDLCNFWLTRFGAMNIVVRDSAGDSCMDDANDALRVNVVTGGTSGTEYTVNAVVPADPVGGTFVMERDDALSALTEAEGDWTNPRANANGALWVAVDGTVTVGSHAVTNAGTFAVQVDGTALTRLTDIETNTDSGAVVGNGAAATAQRVTLASDSTGIVALTTSTASIGKLAANSGVDIGDVDVTSVPADPFGANADAAVAAGASGSIQAKLRRVTQGLEDLKSLIVLAAGSNLIGQVNLEPKTTGGLTKHKTISAATTNATSVKASAGQLHEIVVSNINAAARYLKLYDKASAPTVGTDVPAWTLLIPGNTAGSGLAKTIPMGLSFTSGIAFALTTGVADTDTGAVAANELVVNLGYK